MLGSAASLCGGVKLHSACKLNMSLSQKNDEDWQSTLVLVADKTSWMRDKENWKLDMNLRKMTGRKYLLYGGIVVIFIGNFFQIPPQGKTALYHNMNLQWSSLNTGIFLENSHRFKNDPEWGQLLSQFRVGTYTKDDIEKITQDGLVDIQR